MSNKLNRAIELGQIRHLWTLIGSVVLGLGISNPEWLPTLFSEAVTQIIFSLIGGAITLIQIFRSANAPEKEFALGRLDEGTDPKIAGIIRHVLTVVGTLVTVFAITVPSWVSGALSQEGIQLVVTLVGAATTYLQFLKSSTAPEKRIISDEEFVAIEARRAS
jgi:hypothetical protein